MNPIRDQGDCGACWAFAALGSIESRYKIYHGTLYSLSVQQLVDCCHYGGSFGCGGGFQDPALDYVRDKGIMTAADYPYIAMI